MAACSICDSDVEKSFGRSGILAERGILFLVKVFLYNFLELCQTTAQAIFVPLRLDKRLPSNLVYGLTPVLDAIRASDGLIIGSPNYLSELTASFRALYERLIFQNLTYNLERPCCAGRRIPVLLIMTSNAPDTMYRDMIEGYRQTLERFVGPTDVLICGDTLQLKDYGKTDWPWTMFDPEAKKARHESVFPLECREAFDKGAALAER